MKGIKLLILLIFFSYKISSQNKTEIAFYNVGLGAFAGGIGAVINKKPNQKLGSVFLKGFLQGGLGGYIIYNSKRLAGEITQEKSWEYGWYAKITNSIGTSIVENASANRNFWERWHLNFGFNRIEFYTKDKFKVKYKIMPISLALTLRLAVSNKFEFKRTFQTGEFIFSTDKIAERGIAYGNVLLINNRALNSHDVYSHEIIHVYQYYDFNFVNSFLNKSYKKWGKKSRSFKNFNSLFYIDAQAPVVRGLYLLENINRKCFYDNFFEHEADFFSRKLGCED